MAGHAFISYSRRDAEYVARLVAELRRQSLNAWLDEGIEPGEKWIKTIDRQISECAVFVPVVSEASATSEWVEREILRADQLHKPMLPLLLSGQPPMQLMNVQHELVRGGRLPGPGWFGQVARLLGGTAPEPVPASEVAPEGPAVTGARLRHTLRGHTSRVRTVAWSADGHLLASGGEDSAVVVWDATGGEIRRRVTGFSDWICAVGWSPEERLLAMAGGERRILVSSGAGTRATLTGHRGNILALAWSRDGRQIASTSADGRVLVHQSRGGGQPVVLDGHCGPVFSVSWARSGGLLATGSADRTVRLWDPVRACEARKPYPHGALVRSVAWSPDSRWLAAASAEPAVRVWDTSTDSVTMVIEPPGMVCALSWSLDGALVAGACDDGAVRLWDVGSGAEVATLVGHVGPVRTVAWSRVDAYALASGGDDGTVRVWALPYP